MYFLCFGKSCLSRNAASIYEHNYAHAYSWSGKTLTFFLQVLFFYHWIWMTDNFFGTVSVSFISFIFLLFHKQTMILMALYQSLPIWTVRVSAFAYVWSPWWRHCLTLFSVTLYITTAFYFAFIYWKCPAELHRTKTLNCKFFYGSMAPDLPITLFPVHTPSKSHTTPLLTMLKTISLDLSIKSKTAYIPNDKDPLAKLSCSLTQWMLSMVSVKWTLWKENFIK